MLLVSPVTTFFHTLLQRPIYVNIISTKHYKLYITKPFSQSPILAMNMPFFNMLISKNFYI